MLFSLLFCFTFCLELKAQLGANIFVAAYCIRNHGRGLANEWPPGLVNFVPAVAYHICLNLPQIVSQPGGLFLAQVCTEIC